MAEERKYYIYVSGALVEVSRDVYYAYHQEERRAKTLEEKDQRNGLVQYSGLDTAELSGEELLPDRDAASVEDAAIANILKDRLHRCLAQLPRQERRMIHALYFEGLSERQLAQKSGVHYMTVHSRKTAILQKLKKLMKI